MDYGNCRTLLERFSRLRARQANLRSVSVPGGQTSNQLTPQATSRLQGMTPTPALIRYFIVELLNRVVFGSNLKGTARLRARQANLRSVSVPGGQTLNQLTPQATSRLQGMTPTSNVSLFKAG